MRKIAEKIDQSTETLSTSNTSKNQNNKSQYAKKNTNMIKVYKNGLHSSNNIEIETKDEDSLKKNVHYNHEKIVDIYKKTQENFLESRQKDEKCKDKKLLRCSFISKCPYPKVSYI